MTFLIADTFTDSLARLTGDEQKAVKTTAFDLQMNPSAPGLSFHKLDSTRNQRQLVTKDYSVLRAWPAPPARGRPSSRCTELFTWPDQSRMTASCSPRSPNRWRMRCARA
jgi:hypothetical protein